MSEVVGLEFQGPAGEVLRFEWDADDLAAMTAADAPADPVWRLGGDLDWTKIEAVRIVSARLAGDRLVVIAAIRPIGSEGHGDELVAGAIGDLEEFEQLEESLVSIEYGPDALPRRLGLELYRADGAMAIRIAGDATAADSSREGGLDRLRAAFTLRSAGDSGVGVLDVLTGASDSAA